MEAMISDSWISLTEAAQYLGVNKDSVRNWIKKQIFLLTKLVNCGNSNVLNLMSGLRVGKVQILFESED